jgi:hypothetical protein
MLVESADGVGYEGANGRGYRGLMAARPHDRKGYRMRGAFRSSRRPKCTAKACLFGPSLLSLKLGSFDTLWLEDPTDDRF